MALRKASAYTKKIARPYTRNSKSKRKAFIKTVPFSKVTKITGGKAQDYNAGKFKYILKLIAMERVQIRDNAIESCRMFLSNRFEKIILAHYFNH